MPTTFCDDARLTEEAGSPDIVVNGMNSTKTRTFTGIATSDQNMIDAVQAYIAATETVDGIPLTAPPVIKLKTTRGIDGGQSTYAITVEYKHAGRDEQSDPATELTDVGQEKVTASFSGASSTLTTALAQTAYPAPTLAPPTPGARDVGKAINVQHDGKVEGTEVNARTGSFTVSTVIDAATATNAWFKARFEQVWTLNHATFRSWPEGSVALTGMDLRQRSDGNWEIDYNFAIQPPETITEIGGFALGQSVDKEGWQYIWVMFRPTDDDEKVVPEIIGAYIADLYPKSDFSDLEITV